MKRWPLLFVFIGLFSCTWVKNIQDHTVNLSPYLHKDEIKLEKDVRLTITRGIIKTKHEYFLRKGKYTSILKSTKGIYYISPKRGFYDLLSKNKGLAVGGVYIAEGNPKEAYIWVWPMMNMNRTLSSPSPGRPLNEWAVQPEWHLLQSMEYLNSVGKGFYSKPWLDMDFKLNIRSYLSPVLSPERGD